MLSVVAVVNGLSRRYWSLVTALQPQALTPIAPPLAKTNSLQLKVSVFASQLGHLMQLLLAMLRHHVRHTCNIGATGAQELR